MEEALQNIYICLALRREKATQPYGEACSHSLVQVNSEKVIVTTTGFNNECTGNDQGLKEETSHFFEQRQIIPRETSKLHYFLVGQL